MSDPKQLLIDGCKDVIARLKLSRLTPIRNYYLSMPDAVENWFDEIQVDEIEKVCSSCMVGSLVLSLSRIAPQSCPWVSPDGKTTMSKSNGAASQYGPRDDNGIGEVLDPIELSRMENFFEGIEIYDTKIHDSDVEKEFLELCQLAYEVTPKLAARIACEVVIRKGGIAEDLVFLRDLLNQSRGLSNEKMDELASAERLFDLPRID